MHIFGQGLNIVEVAHDIAQSVSNYISNRLALVNSYDTWHDTHFYPFCCRYDNVYRNEECGQVIEDNLHRSEEAHWGDLVSAACGQTYNTCSIFCLSVKFCSYSFREEHQGALVLGHEELRGRSCEASCPGQEHPQALPGTRNDSPRSGMSLLP